MEFPSSQGELFFGSQAFEDLVNTASSVEQVQPAASKHDVLVPMLIANCRALEKTLKVLMEQYPKLEQKIVDLEQDFITISEQNRLRYEALSLNSKFIVDSVSILTNRREEKLKKDCERRANKKRKIDGSLDLTTHSKRPLRTRVSCSE